MKIDPSVCKWQSFFCGYPISIYHLLDTFFKYVALNLTEGVVVLPSCAGNFMCHSIYFPKHQTKLKSTKRFGNDSYFPEGMWFLFISHSDWLSESENLIDSSTILQIIINLNNWNNENICNNSIILITWGDKHHKSLIFVMISGFQRDEKDSRKNEWNRRFQGGKYIYNF